MPRPLFFQQEIRLWKRYWEDTTNEKPATLQATFDEINPLRFENIHYILHCLLIVSVTSATVERAHSSLKHIKTVKRSTMGQDRLNALMLMYVHRDIPINFEKIIDEFASSNPRRMLLKNPLGK